jgi:hypothetical protein
MNTRLLPLLSMGWAYSVYSLMPFGNPCSGYCHHFQAPIVFSLGQQRQNIPQFVATEYV